MTYASQTFDVDGTKTSFDISFDYINPDHVKVYVDGVATTDAASTNTHEWDDNDTLLIRKSDETPLDDGTTVQIKRETPINDALVEFQDGAVIRSRALNNNTLQTLYVAQEIYDEGTSRLGVNNEGNYTANDKRIEDLADPVNDHDAVSKAYISTHLTTIEGHKTDAETAREQAQNAARAVETAKQTVERINQNLTGLWERFEDRYLGSAAVAPLTDSEGEALVEGALWYDTVGKAMKVWSGINWIDMTTAPQAFIKEFYFTPTAGTTVITGDDINTQTLAFTNTNLQVTLNGIRLGSQDFAATGGDTVTLVEATDEGDVVQITAFSSFVAADAVSAALGGTFGGDVTVTGAVTSNSLNLGNNWTISTNGNSIGFFHNEVIKFRFDTNGQAYVNGSQLLLTPIGSYTPPGQQ